jgi:hypothetical protein
MLYVAEVPATGDDLTEQMKRMRTWLDHQGYEPSSFRLGAADARKSLRVYFKLEAEAAAFASEFGGSLLSPPVTDDVVVWPL